MACATGRCVSAGALSRTERVAVHLFPQRALLLAAGLGLFLLAAHPLVRVARGDLVLSQWHVVLFAGSVPFVLWALALGCLAIFFHPVHGLVGRIAPDGPSPPNWLRGFLRAYAALSVWAFAVAPLIVLFAAAS